MQTQFGYQCWVCVVLCRNVTVNGDIWAWGNNRNGFMGFQENNDAVIRVPRKLPLPAAIGSSMKQLSVGCVGQQWQGFTKSCIIWVLTGEHLADGFCPYPLHCPVPQGRSVLA